MLSTTISVEKPFARVPSGIPPVLSGAPEMAREKQRLSTGLIGMKIKLGTTISASLANCNFLG